MSFKIQVEIPFVSQENVSVMIENVQRNSTKTKMKVKTLTSKRMTSTNAENRKLSEDMKIIVPSIAVR